MRRSAIIAVALAAVALAATVTAQDKADRQDKAASPGNQFVGEWVNVDPNAVNIVSVTVARVDGGALEIRTGTMVPSRGNAAPKTLQSGKTTLSLLGDNSRAEDLPYGFAVWPNGPVKLYMSLR